MHPRLHHYHLVKNIPKLFLDFSLRRTSQSFTMSSVTDIITLENFQAKMPKWEPNLPNHLFALVDMGRFVTPYVNAHHLDMTKTGIIYIPSTLLWKCIHLVWLRSRV